MTAYGSLCDDFAVSVNLSTKLDLPGRRADFATDARSMANSLWAFPAQLDHAEATKQE